MPQSVSAATDLDLISYLKAIPDAGMRRGVRIPAWYLLLVAVLGILSKCESLRDLERFARRHHPVLTESLGIELKRSPSDSAFRYFFLQVDVVAVCAAIRDWTIAQIPGGAGDLDQLICDGKTLRGSIEATSGGGSAFIAQVTLYSAALGPAPRRIPGDGVWQNAPDPWRCGSHSRADSKCVTGTLAGVASMG